MSTLGTKNAGQSVDHRGEIQEVSAAVRVQVAPVIRRVGCETEISQCTQKKIGCQLDGVNLELYGSGRIVTKKVQKCWEGYKMTLDCLRGARDVRTVLGHYEWKGFMLRRAAQVILTAENDSRDHKRAARELHETKGPLFAGLGQRSKITKIRNFQIPKI